MEHKSYKSRGRARASTAALCLALAFACGLAACRDKKVDPPPDPPKAEEDVVLTPEALQSAGVTTAKARLEPRRTSVAVTGLLDFVPNRVARVGPLIDGRITSIRVDPGQTVPKGAILAREESVDVGRARSDYLSSQVKVAFAERERQRQYRLADGGLTTGQDVLNAENERNLADLEKRAAAERLRAVGVQVDSSKADTSGQGDPGTGVALTTPLGGLVLEVNARLGQAVKASDTLFVVGDIERVWMIVDVYERDLARVHVGDEARARVLAYPDRIFSGKVDYVGGVVDAVRRAVQARIVLENPDGALRPGMSTTAHIYGAAGAVGTGVTAAKDASAEEPMALVVPRGAIQTIDGQPFVFVAKGAGKFELRAVERGADVENETEITRGLGAGETIAVEGTFILKSEALREQMGKND